MAFPLAFVVGRTRGLPLIAAAALALQVPLAWAGARVLELDGLTLALVLSTVLVLAALLVDLGTFAGAARGLLAAGLAVTGVTLAAFLPPALVFGSVVSAVIGLVLYVMLFALLRPRGLMASWHYLRALGGAESAGSARRA